MTTNLPLATIMAKTEWAELDKPGFLQPSEWDDLAADAVACAGAATGDYGPIPEVPSYYRDTATVDVYDGPEWVITLGWIGPADHPRWMTWVEYMLEQFPSLTITRSFWETFDYDISAETNDYGQPSMIVTPVGRRWTEYRVRTVQSIQITNH